MTVRFVGSTSGYVDVNAPAIAGTNTITLPANTGTIISTASSNVVTQSMLTTGVAGTGPAFLAYSAGGQTFGTDSIAKLNYTLEQYDSANCYDTSLSRFTPNVAGYYYVSAFAAATGTAGIAQTTIYKNGAQWAAFPMPLNASGAVPVASVLLYMNGTTDYVEVYFLQNSGGNYTTLTSRNDLYQFCAFLARAA